MGKHRKWFWISGLYDYKRDILLNSMILSGTHCIILPNCIMFWKMFNCPQVVAQLVKAVKWTGDEWSFNQYARLSATSPYIHKLGTEDNTQHNRFNYCIIHS